jgi:hypothetical protein
MINNNIRKYFKELLGKNLPVITNVVKQNYQLNCPPDFSEQTLNWNFQT